VYLNDRLAKKASLLSLAIFLVFLGVVHGYALSSRGILEHDEGHNLLAARTYTDVIRWVATGGPLHSSTEQLAGLKDTLHRQGGTLYPAGKPGYVVGLALASLVFGVSQATGLWLAWLAGVLVVALSGYVAFQLSGRGWVAAAITMAGVGLSPLLGYLSREIGGTIWSMGFGLAGLALLLRSPCLRATQCARLRAVAAGALFGYGITCHYNLLPAIAAAFFADLLHTAAQDEHQQNIFQLTRRALRHRVRTYAFALLGIAVVLGAFEVCSLVAEYKLHTIYPKYQNYLAELVRIVGTYQLPALHSAPTNEGVRGWGAAAWLYMGARFMQEGILLILLLVVAVTMAFSRTILRPVLPALAFFVVLLAFWLLHPWKLERSWGMLVVAGWLVGAGMVQLLLERSSNGFRAIVLVAIVGATIQVVFRPWLVLWDACSPMPKVVDRTLAYVQQNGGFLDADCAGSSFAPLWKWTIIERARNPRLATALRHVDFSSFRSSTIVFTDPNSWRDPEFAVLRPAVAKRQPIARETSRFPAWHLSAFDLRTSIALTTSN
jgi:hypothetical protein